jgi:uncharacterized protein YbbC (DUF1343 family)
LPKAGFNIAALFAPEHGLSADQQDQAPIDSDRDRHTNRPIFSLYGKTLSPTPAMLEKIDALLFDLQDIGIRYYTFIWTMALAMKACAQAGKPFLVLDRPNPLGGQRTDGNVLDPAYTSFVGLHPLPVEHGFTVGELALYLNTSQGWGADLHVVPMTGWTRDQRFSDTGLPWVLPSPNMPSLETATVYGGACLLEATNLSEGRGTTRPFEIVGAPFIDGARLADALHRWGLPGVRFRPLVFRPTFNKWAGKTCGGVQWHVTDTRRFRSFGTGIRFLHTVKRLWPKQFRWASPPYEYETVKPPIDILCGTDRVRLAIDRGEDLRPLERSWRLPLQRFEDVRRRFRLYPDTAGK